MAFCNGKNCAIIVSKLCPVYSQFSQKILVVFGLLRRELIIIVCEKNSGIWVVRIQFAEKSCIFTLLSTRKRRILVFTVHHRGSTNNIQDLRNFAHFAQKVSTRKYKKKPALDGERVYFKTCAQQAQNLRREQVHYRVPQFLYSF